MAMVWNRRGQYLLAISIGAILGGMLWLIDGYMSERSVRPGMTEAEVRMILGPPSIVEYRLRIPVDSPEPSAAMEDWLRQPHQYVYWSWLPADVSPTGDLVVYIDRSGRVHQLTRRYQDSHVVF